MPMKITGAIRVTDSQLERLRKIAARQGWMVGSTRYSDMGSHTQVNRELADGRALFVPLPDPVQRAMLGRFLKSTLQLGRDSATTEALTALLAALELAEELKEEAEGENTAVSEPAHA
jgi:hypothetical protein